ncbi:unnamed protein product [Cladocopium goreaui]|uniref:Uncharacterized protein n=1 Tax=Cladocopium goreaui TaxID=2562237 RepID=A0A9P1G118_9DINO|nr:unnamed protein product [Cladocopium goreaui]
MHHLVLLQDNECTSCHPSHQETGAMKAWSADPKVISKDHGKQIKGRGAAGATAAGTEGFGLVGGGSASRCFASPGCGKEQQEQQEQLPLPQLPSGRPPAVAPGAAMREKRLAQAVGKKHHPRAKIMKRVQKVDPSITKGTPATSVHLIFQDHWNKLQVSLGATAATKSSANAVSTKKLFDLQLTED